MWLTVVGKPKWHGMHSKVLARYDMQPGEAQSSFHNILARHRPHNTLRFYYESVVEAF
jgi:hypothetical protein